MADKLIIYDDIEDIKAKEFCEKFIYHKDVKKYLFGRNVYANDILKQIEIDGFIDDFYTEKYYLNKQVFRLEDVEKDSLVLVLSSGRVKSAIKRVKSFGLEVLDYFAFYKYSGLQLKEILFNEGFKSEFNKNRSRFEAIYNILSDDISKKNFLNLVNFKLSYDIKYLQEFKYLEDKQYFEDFLGLQNVGEVFLDIGGYDGFTSEEFIKRCPNYKAVHIFEPDLNNLEKAKERLNNYENINFYDTGLSNVKDILKFDIGGSASKISEDGNIEIKVDRLDDIIGNNEVTFIKMDIEGAEIMAIEGAEKTILNNHPKMALSVYHKPEDFYKIPEKIFSLRNDYKIYLRHYTESIYETIMFFIPIEKNEV